MNLAGFDEVTDAVFSCQIAVLHLLDDPGALSVAVVANLMAVHPEQACRILRFLDAILLVELFHSPDQSVFATLMSAAEDLPAHGLLVAAQATNLLAGHLDSGARNTALRLEAGANLRDTCVISDCVNLMVNLSIISMVFSKVT